MSRFLISCGGTGGHLAPGIAVGEALIKAGHQVSFIISEKKVDSRLVEKYRDFKFYKAPGAAFSYNPLKSFKFLYMQARAVKFAVDIMKAEKSDAAIAFGGFNSLGISFAAKIAGKPLILHEANRLPGKAIKFLGKFADRIYIPAGVKISRGTRGIVKNAGYPVRSEIKKLDTAESRKFFGFPTDAKLLLVCGGSQGASALNNWAHESFPVLAESGIDVLCISGPGKMDRSDLEATDCEGNRRIFKTLEFCDNMAAAMSAANIVVARAGAGSIAEFARCRIVPILVPFPYSADNHQEENAHYVERNGAGICVHQNKLNTLLGEVLRLMHSEVLLDKMRASLERLDDTAELGKIVADIEHIIADAQKP